ncbi:MAG: hypothetical protein U0270_20500 [Labilithrix sp.]
MHDLLTFAGKSGRGTHAALDGFLDRRGRDHAKGLAIDVVRARDDERCALGAVGETSKAIRYAPEALPSALSRPRPQS